MKSDKRLIRQPIQTNTSPQLAAASFRRHGKTTLWIGYVLPISVYASVVLFAPLDVLDQFPALRYWSDWVRGLLLTAAGNVDIYRHARSTTFPQVAMFTSALGVSVAWFIAIATIIQGLINYKHIASLDAELSLKDRLVRVFLLPLFGLVCMWAFFCIRGDPSFAAGLTTQSRSGYLFISTIAVLAFGGGVGIWPSSARHLFSVN